MHSEDVLYKTQSVRVNICRGWNGQWRNYRRWCAEGTIQSCTTTIWCVRVSENKKKEKEWFRNDEMFSGLIRSALFATHHSLSPSLSPSLSIGCLNRKTGTCSFKSVRVWLWANDVCSLLRVTVTHPLNFAYQRWQCILYVRVQKSIDASRWCHGIGWLYERKFFV